MSEVAPVPAAPAKSSTKKKATSKPKTPGPSASELILQAVAASKDRNGVSLAALKKYLASKGYDVEKNNSRLKTVIKALVAKGVLDQTKGTGASGSFKMNKKTEGKAKAPAKVVKKANKPAPKKMTSNKKPVAAKKVTNPTTPNKVKKPAKSTRKSVATKKSPAVKKTNAAKKAPAKRASKPKAVKKVAPRKK